MVDVAEEVATLLAEPLERFVEARTARVKALKADGRRDEAAALAKVRKPARLVWALGALARAHPEAAAEAVEAADDLAAVQEAGEGDVRSLLGRFRDSIAVLARATDDADGSIDGTTLDLAVRTVLADPPARQAWSEGRLLELPRDEALGTPLGVGAGDAPSRPARSTTPRPSGGRPRRSPHQEDGAREQEERTQREAAAREVEQVRRRALAALDEAERSAQETSAERTAAGRAVSDLEERRAALEVELVDACDRAERAERADDEATHRLGEARRRVDEGAR